MSANPDKSFIVTFLGVLGVLGGFTLSIIVIAALVGRHDRPQDPQALARLEARIAPIGKEITNAAALAPPPEAAPHPALTGEQVVAQVCSACHGTGVMNAPKIGDKAAWESRFKAAGGIDGLLAVAQKGKNLMPPRGGKPDLTDAELKSAIETMLKQTGIQ